MMRNRTKEPGDGVRELKAKLAEKEKVREELEAAHSAARKEVKRLSRAVTEAEKGLALSAAAAVSGTWFEKREERKREQAVAEARGRLAEARREAEAKQDALDQAMDEIGELQAALAGPRALAIRKRAIELASLLRRQQEEALQTARQMAALYRVVEAATPKRLVFRRSTRFLRVIISDPALVAIMHPDEKDRPASVVAYREYFMALKGAKAGKWQIADGEDLSLRKEEIETQWGDGPLPAEVERIQNLDLGELYRANGKPVGELEGRSLDFLFLRHRVTEEELRQAAQSIEEGA